MIFFGSIQAKNADILRHILVLKERLKACSVLRRRGGMHKMQKCERNGVCVSGLILRMLLIRGEAQV